MGQGPDLVLALAHGDLPAEDAAELQVLKAQIHRDSGFFCAGYKERCLRRRLAIRMRARGVHRYGDYGRLLRDDPEEYESLLRVLTINVSKFFRNIEVWRELERLVIPSLFELNAPLIRIWSAGSAGGEEPYSIAILLREYALAHGLLHRLRRFEILGVDIDREVLESARTAEYNETALTELPGEYLDRWFSREGGYRLSDDVRQMVRFEPLDLLSDPLPDQQHLILCRNVNIYFEEAIQEALQHRLRTSLVDGGYLVLGQVETISRSLASEFRILAHRERIYQCL